MAEVKTEDRIGLIRDRVAKELKGIRCEIRPLVLGQGSGKRLMATAVVKNSETSCLESQPFLLTHELFGLIDKISIKPILANRDIIDGVAEVAGEFLKEMPFYLDLPGGLWEAIRNGTYLRKKFVWPVVVRLTNPRFTLNIFKASLVELFSAEAMERILAL